MSKKLSFNLLIFTFFFSKLYSYSYEKIKEAPITFAYSLLKPNTKLPKTILYAGERGRFSSSSGVVWMPGDHYLISIHLFSGLISIYEFDETTKSLSPIQCLGEKEGFFLDHPENLDISPDGKWVAISEGSGLLNFFKFDANSGTLYPGHFILRHKRNDWVHGIAYSNDGNFLGTTSIGPNPKICIYKQKANKFTIHQVLKTKIRPLEPKSVAFSPDNRFLAACYCQVIGTNVCKDPQATLEIYRFDPNSQLFDPDPISTFTKVPGNMETVKFSPDGTYLVTTDQALDEVFVHNFDPSSGQLLSSQVLLQNPEAELNFPHGLAFSNNGKYLAVTNYGDDRITIYEFDLE